MGACSLPEVGGAVFDPLRRGFGGGRPPVEASGEGTRHSLSCHQVHLQLRRLSKTHTTRFKNISVQILDATVQILDATKIFPVQILDATMKPTF